MSRLSVRLRNAVLIRLRCMGCGGGRSSSDAPPIVVVDESLGELFSISDPGFQGYALAARALRERGYRVTTNLGPLEALASGVGRVEGQVLVVALPTQLPSPRAAAAVRDFVQRGGGLLLLGEHDGIYGNAASLNALLEGWPIAVDSGQAPSVVRPGLSPGFGACGPCGRTGCGRCGPG